MDREERSAQRFAVHYHIRASHEEEAKAIAFSIQIEQTVEFPYEFLRNPWLGTRQG